MHILAERYGVPWMAPTPSLLPGCSALLLYNTEYDYAHTTTCRPGSPPPPLTPVHRFPMFSRSAPLAISLPAMCYIRSMLLILCTCIPHTACGDRTVRDKREVGREERALGGVEKASLSIKISLTHIGSVGEGGEERV